MEKNRLLIVYNICGISGKNNIAYYVDAMKTLIANADKRDHILISGCMTHPEHKKALKEYFKNSVDYLWTDEIRTISFTFNRSVREAIERYGLFEGYLYVDSGCSLDDPTTVDEMYATFNNTDAHMVSVLTDDDSGAESWFGKKELADSDEFRIPVGKALNLHVHLFGEALRSAYGNVLPDIFASYCMESIFTFMCAALEGSWVVRTDYVVHHAWSMDGASSGFNPHGIIAQVMPPHYHLVPEAPRHMTEILKDPQVKESGFGYEEVQKVLIHDPAKYTEEGHSTVGKVLSQFIQKNMFLSDEQFSYNTMVGEYECL